MYSAAIDVTERKQSEEELRKSAFRLRKAEQLCKLAEKALRDSEARFRMLFDQANDGIFLLSPDGALMSVNEAFARMHGYSTEDMSRMNVADLDTPASSRLAPERLRRLLAGEAQTFEVEHYHKDGHVFPLEVSAAQISVGGQRFIQCIHRDITERKRAQEELLQLRKAMDASDDVIFLTDRKGTIVSMNPSFTCLYGYTADIIAQRGILEDDVHFIQKPFALRELAAKIRQTLDSPSH